MWIPNWNDTTCHPLNVKGQLVMTRWQEICNRTLKIKFSSYISKFRVEQLQSHIWGRASYTYMRKCANNSPSMRRPFVYDFATAPFWISLYMRKIWFSFYQCTIYPSHRFIQNYCHRKMFAFLKGTVSRDGFFKNQYQNYNQYCRRCF